MKELVKVYDSARNADAYRTDDLIETKELPNGSVLLTLPVYYDGKGYNIDKDDICKTKWQLTCSIGKDTKDRPALLILGWQPC